MTVIRITYNLMVSGLMGVMVELFNFYDIWSMDKTLVNSYRWLDSLFDFKLVANFCPGEMRLR